MFTALPMVERKGNEMARVCVTGAAGFIGHHLVRYLKKCGHWVRGVDYRLPEYKTPADEVDWTCDLRDFRSALEALNRVRHVYALAADMGGMGYISSYHDTILQNNLRINLNTAYVVKALNIEPVLYTSSACVYPERLQENTEARNLTESDAWDGKPDTAYGIEKLTSEEIYRRMGEEAGIAVRIARFHNIYGPEGDWYTGREKAPAAICRKVAEAKRDGRREIEIWGDGEQTRSFCYISDCLEMLYRLAQSKYDKPLNIGTDRAVSIDELAHIVMDAANWQAEIVHVPGPQGVRGRNADLTAMRKVLDYEPQVTLEDGIAETYAWIEEQVNATTQ